MELGGLLIWTFLLGLVEGNLNVGNRSDCARYVAVTGEGHEEYEQMGIPINGTPAIFILDVDANLTEAYSVYRNEFGGCLYIDQEGDLALGLNCSTNPEVNDEDYFAWFGLDFEECFPYGHHEIIIPLETIRENNRHVRVLNITTPAVACSECRIVDIAGAGYPRGTYTLKDHYDPACGPNTDMCAYEMNNQTYCFEKNGNFTVNFQCPP